MFLSTAILLAVTLASPVWAQLNMAQCVTGFDWNRNSLGQDPCTIGSFLDASCRGLVEYTYSSLTDSIEHYIPPRANHSGDVMCDCNTVAYSLYMSCASCQGGQVYSWVEWALECSTVYISQYPANIPEETAVPRWAYYDVTSLPNQTWNESVAITIIRSPEELLKRVDSVTPPDSSTPDSSTPDSTTPAPFPGTTTTTVMTNTNIPIVTPFPTKTTVVKTQVRLTDPTIPANPTDLAMPANPTDSTIPANPTDSPIPADPKDSLTPANPTNPAVPTNPTNPTMPTNPTNPTMHANPADPTNPTDPADVSDPTNTVDSPGPMTPTSTTSPSGSTVPNSKSDSLQSTSSASRSRPTTSIGNTNSSSTNASNTKGGRIVWATIAVLFIWVLV